MAMSTTRPYHYDGCTTGVGILVAVPPLNQRRRAELADAVISLLAESGTHGVTHRAVDRCAGVPAGTASNYFRSRETLLVAAAERIGQLHYTDMDTIAYRRRSPTRLSTRNRAIELIAESLFLAATAHRSRYLAVFELQLESLRRPALAKALSDLHHRSIAFTTDHHATHGLEIPTEAVPTLVTLFGGALFTLVTSPSDTITRTITHDIATAIVRGGLGDP
jgi:DNA-binding transcriptional regulator YbjK